MKHIFFILSLSFFFSFNASSQDELVNVEAVNNYKYIIIPLQYDLFKDQDKYQINSLTKFLFNKYGYTSLFENDPFPEDLRQNKCLALTADVVKVRGGFLITKVKIDLKDCSNQIVVSSKVGKSKEKEFKTAYNLAVRGAFESFQFHKYNYEPDPSVVAASSNSTNQTLKATDEEAKLAQEEIDRLKQEVAALKDVKQVEVVPEVETPTKEKTIVKSEIQKESSKLLYAQPIDNGFQVVDQTPKVVMILLKTPKQNTYIVKDQNAIVYKEDGFWYLSKNDGNTTSLETLNIKF